MMEIKINESKMVQTLKNERFFDTMLGAYRLNGPYLYKALSNDIFKFSFSFQGYQAAIRGTDPTQLGGILYYSNVKNTYARI